MRIVKDLEKYKKEKEVTISDIERMKSHIPDCGTLVVGGGAYAHLLKIFYLDLLIYKDKLKALQSILGLKIIVNNACEYES